MFTLYGNDFSSRSNKVKLCANAIGIPFEFIEVDLLKGAHKKPWYLQLHPGGKIPVIDDNGFRLFESVAIMKYLCRKQQSPLYPHEMKAQAIVDQWCDYASQHLDVQMVRVAYPIFIAPKIGEPVSEKSIEMGKKMIYQLMPVFELALSQSAYLAGADLTIADINLLAITDPAKKLSLDFQRYPHFTKWRAKLKAMPFYQKTKTAFSDAS